MERFWHGIRGWLRERSPGGGEALLGDLRLRYREFTYLLRANNEVLGVIAELEQRLGSGDPLGVEYLRLRYVEAGAKVFKMCQHLDRISDHAYPGLVQAFDRIRREIDEAFAALPGPADEALVLPLAGLDARLGHLVGMKAARLAEVGALGLPVPPGFVVTATAFRRWLATSGLDSEIKRLLMFLEPASFASLEALHREMAERMAGAPLGEELENAIQEGLAGLFQAQGGPRRLILRSSAVGEDGEASHAGQYQSVLNVDPADFAAAYRQVAASLYSPQAVLYRLRRGFRAEESEMAVLVLGMLDPVVSGVLYTRDPLSGERGDLLINAVYGLGKGLVDGSVSPDAYYLSRVRPPVILGREVGEKQSRFLPAPEGVREEAVPPELALRPALTPAQAARLAEMGLDLEKAFGRPQDVEWSLAADGNFQLLQSRPLYTLREAGGGGESRVGAPLLLEGGRTARPGVGAGPVHLVRGRGDLADFPEGGVLVARESSPVYASVLPKAAAVVTELGGVTGHMASLTREFGVPALVGVKGATAGVQAGELVTVDAGARRVYRGRVEALLARQARREEVLPRRAPRPAWHRVAELITPLSLIDPKSPDFRPERCRTFHDIVRYVHEKSFSAMFLLGNRLESHLAEARRLRARLPFELWLLDLEGGIREGAGRELELEDLTSVPGKAFLAGVLDPRIVWQGPRPVSMRGMFSVISGSLFTPPSDGQERDLGQRAYAIMSRDYLNFNSRVGYHFAAVDSVCEPNQNNNYVSFQFKGGAATEDRRALRCELIGSILGRLGFAIDRKADLVHAFLKKQDQQATARLLTDLGRLTIFTRQMDMLTSDPRAVAWLADAFLSGNFNLEAGPPGLTPPPPAAPAAPV